MHTTVFSVVWQRKDLLLVASDFSGSRRNVHRNTARQTFLTCAFRFKSAIKKTLDERVRRVGVNTKTQIIWLHGVVSETENVPTERLICLSSVAEGSGEGVAGLQQLCRDSLALPTTTTTTTTCAHHSSSFTLLPSRRMVVVL